MFLASASSGFALLVPVLIAAVIVLYFMPTIVAMKRAVPNKGSVAVINAFLGWSLIGWVVALAMAMRSQQQSVHVHVHSPSPASSEAGTWG